MNQPTPRVIIVEALTRYDEEDATRIGKLLPFLSDKFDGQPVSKESLTEIIESPHHVQLVARDETERIVGIATLSITLGFTSGRNAYLNDFVVDPSIQGAGIGSKVWEAMIDWCKNNKLTALEFTSRPSRESAQQFYLKRGAIIRETNFFKKTID